METHKQSMVVQHFSVETDLHMSRNMRFCNYFLSIRFPVFMFILYLKELYACVQVEFNKAAQSLTDAQIPTAQKKSTLTRLAKVDSCS